jgi:Dirigent-like protein
MCKRSFAACLLACAAVTVPNAFAGADESSEVVRVVSVTTTSKYVDKRPAGVGAGDVIVERDRLLNDRAQFGKPKGARVGWDTGRFTFVSAEVARFRGTAHLPGGTLTVKGRVRIANPNGVLTLVGGTGAWAHARGSVTVRDLPGDKRVLNVYRVRRG